MKLTLLLLPFLALLLAASPALLPAAQPPNVLMIAVDDMNDFIGAMGHPDAITPNLDKLIKKGTLFSNAHCQSPMCSPSRAAIMTGLRPSTTGIYGMIDDDLIKQTNDATLQSDFLFQYFKDRGYHTMGIGKLFHEHAPEGLLDESGSRKKASAPHPNNLSTGTRRVPPQIGALFPSGTSRCPIIIHLNGPSSGWGVATTSPSFCRWVS